MSDVTFQILDGMERGRVFADLETPFTIGREEDNGIQLNDERVSRFHLKIQEDAGQVILTDLESTNGTRVNAVPTQLRILQIGDLVSIGRCLLVFGSPEEIANRFQDVYPSPLGPVQKALGDLEASSIQSADDEGADGTFERGSDLASDWSERVDSASQKLAAIPPPVPDTFRLVQQAQLIDLITYFHQQIQVVMQQAQEAGTESSTVVRVLPGMAWRQLVELEMTIASMIREVAELDS